VQNDTDARYHRGATLWVRCVPLRMDSVCHSGGKLFLNQQNNCQRPLTPDISVAAAQSVAG